MNDKITLGISTCLIGHNVRFDGQHKLDRFLRDTLGYYVEYKPVCPEVECGMPIPRESLRLVGDHENPRLIGNKTKHDYTGQMTQWAEKRLKELEKDNLCGFIFKSGSPSSGMERVRVYNEKGMPEKKGTGIFARLFMNHFPLLPVEEEGRLHDPKLRENFIERIFVMKRWRDDVEKDKKMGNLVRFHTRHKLMIMAHSPKIYREMGKLTAEGKKLKPERLYRQYLELLMQALKLKSTQKKNINVLHHLMGYFKKQLTKDEKQELLEIIKDYRNESIPLIVPVTLINHYVRKYDQPYLKDQFYLNPHPLELKLRTHV